MAADADALSAMISETVVALADLEQHLRMIQTRVSGLGFFARGFVEKDISSATGRTFSDWITAAVRLRALLMEAAAGAAGVAKAAITDELPRVAVFREYLQRAPQKITKVPAAVLKPQQRAELLDQVRLQASSLQRLEADLQRIAGALSQAR